MTHDEYVELQEEARDALYDLIMATEPGTGWKLHDAYREIRQALDREAKAEEQRERGEKLRERASRLETRWQAHDEHWRALSKPDRQRLALNALGDGRLTASQVFQRVARDLPEGGIYRSDIDPVLKRLLDAREVERVREPRSPRMLWVYSARRELEGPIVGLEAAFREGESG